MDEQCPGQGEFITLRDVEAPFGRLSPTVAGHGTGGYLSKLPGFLEAAGELWGSYTLEDRTVFVFEHLTLEVLRDSGLYSTLVIRSSP